MEYVLRCTGCSLTARDYASFRCKRCGSVLEVSYDYSTLVLPAGFRGERIGSRKYLPFLPVRSLSASLGEGGTALACKRIPKYKGVNLFFKTETENPTRSFKDRGSAVEITRALELGFDRIICASTGNMGMSLAHYAKHAGIRATVFINRSGNPEKIRRIRGFGAEIKAVKGDFNESLREAEAYASSSSAFLCGDYHYRKEGQKTVAYEIAEQLRYEVPDFIFLPVGNATLLSALYKGLKEYMMLSLIDRLPRIVAVQSSGCDPLVKAYNRKEKIGYVKPSTVADAIAVGYPTFGTEGITALSETKGYAVRVPDEGIIKSMRHLESLGIYTEAGGAAAFAGFRDMYEGSKRVFNGKTVVVLVTGNNER